MSDSTLDDYKAIGQEGGTEALALVANLMAQSAASNDATMNSLYEGERAAHERTKRRLVVAEERLAQAQDRLARLFDYDPNYWDVP
jgi:hypothetical protein